MQKSHLANIVDSISLDFARFRAFSLNHPEYDIFNKDQGYKIFPTVIRIKNDVPEINDTVFASYLTRIIRIEIKDLQKENISVIAAEVSQIYSKWLRIQLSNILFNLDFLEYKYNLAKVIPKQEKHPFVKGVLEKGDEKYSFKWEIPNIPLKVLTIGELSEEILKDKEHLSLEEEDSLYQIVQNYKENSKAIKKDLDFIIKTNDFIFTIYQINHAERLIDKINSELDKKPEILELIGVSVFYFHYV